MKRAPLASALLPLALACAHRPASPGPTPPAAPAQPPARPEPPAPPPFSPEELPTADDELRGVRGDVDALLRAQALALWGAWTRGEAIDLSKTYAGKERLFSGDAVRQVRAAWQRAAGDERRALSLLHGFLAGEHLARETGASADRLARARAAATFAWSDQRVPPDRVAALLAAEPDAGRRAALHRAAGSVVEKWAALSTAHVADLDAAARRLGHPSLLALAAEIRGEPADALAALAAGVLDATGPAYELVMGELAQSELGAKLEQVRGADVPRLLRAAQEPRLFPGNRALADARALFAGAGLDLAQRPGAAIDGEPRPRKDPRALALPVDPPRDVRLSFVPGAGILDLRGLLHEMGAAAYYAHVASPRVEFRRLGSPVVEAWSQLAQEAAGHPAFLLERSGDTEHHVAPIVRAAAARRLHAARDAALRVLLETRRPKTAAEATQLLERAWARPVAPEEVALALADRDPLLHSADALRAALLAAEVEAALGVRAGGAWWKDARAGDFLRRAFAEGSRQPPESLARALGAPGLRPGTLAELARERIRWADEH